MDKRCGNFGGIIAIFLDDFVNTVLNKGNILVYSVYLLLIRCLGLLLAPWIYQKPKRIILRLNDVGDALDLGELVMEEGIFL